MSKRPSAFDEPAAKRLNACNELATHYRALAKDVRDMIADLVQFKAPPFACQLCERQSQRMGARLSQIDGDSEVVQLCDQCAENECCDPCGDLLANGSGDALYLHWEDFAEHAEWVHHRCLGECDACGELWATDKLDDDGRCPHCQLECAACGECLNDCDDIVQRASSHENISYPAYCKECAPPGYGDEEF